MRETRRYYAQEEEDLPAMVLQLLASIRAEQTGETLKQVHDRYTS